MKMSIVQGGLDAAGIVAGIEDERCGAAVVFEGRVRNHNEGRDVTGLEYEAHEALALREGQVVLEEASARWPIRDVTCVHATGQLKIGDVAVVVAVIADHRGEAFDAARYVIDEIKARLPIWKRECYRGGETEWVNCQRPADR